MSDFDISNIPDQDQVEITDLDPRDDGFIVYLGVGIFRVNRL
jgi:hypothetical protein